MYQSSAVFSARRILLIQRQRCLFTMTLAARAGHRVGGRCAHATFGLIQVREQEVLMQTEPAAVHAILLDEGISRWRATSATGGAESSTQPGGNEHTGEELSAGQGCAGCFEFVAHANNFVRIGVRGGAHQH
jgi:hypothetical protein